MKINYMCLKCKHVYTNGISYPVCNLTHQFVNETKFEYCPKDTACVVAYVEYLKRQIEIWKKACELACREIPNADKFFEFNGITKQDDFYDRASK